MAGKQFDVAGRWDNHRLRFRYSEFRRKIEFDEVEQRSLADYLRVGHVISFANSDIELARGPSETRDAISTFSGTNRSALSAKFACLRTCAARAQRSAETPHPRPHEIAAYDSPLITNGRQLLAMRAALVDRLAPFATEAYRAISGKDERLAVKFAPGSSDDFATDLAGSREREIRLRQTVVGPHRDSLGLSVEEIPAQQYASEGQQRTLALALKIAQARVLAQETGAAPLLLIDDIFGELEPGRRNALLAHLPPYTQKLVTATTMHWCERDIEGPLFHLSDGCVSMKT